MKLNSLFAILLTSLYLMSPITVVHAEEDYWNETVIEEAVPADTEDMGEEMSDWDYEESDKDGDQASDDMMY